MINFILRSAAIVLVAALTLMTVYWYSDTGKYIMFHYTSGTITQDQFNMVKARRYLQGDLSLDTANVKLDNGDTGVALFTAEGYYLSKGMGMPFICDNAGDDKNGLVAFPNECPSITQLKKLSALLGLRKEVVTQGRALGLLPNDE